MLTLAHEKHILLFWKSPALVTVRMDALFVMEERLFQQVGSRTQQGKESGWLGPQDDTNISSTELPSTSWQAQRELQGQREDKVERGQTQKHCRSLSIPMSSSAIGYSHSRKAAAGHPQWSRLSASPFYLPGVQHMIIPWHPEQENSLCLTHR